jgi:hypothetical protein
VKGLYLWGTIEPHLEEDEMVDHRHWPLLVSSLNSDEVPSIHHHHTPPRLTLIRMLCVALAATRGAL